MKNAGHYMPPNFNNRDELSGRLRESLPMEVQTLAYTFQPVEDKAVVHGRPEKGVVYGGKEISDHKGRPVKKSPLLKNSLLCGQCHGLGPVLDSPDMPVQCATLYGSYLHAYIPSGGSKTCQECHMNGGDHYMPPNFNNRDELSARLRESLPMEVQTLAYTFHPDDKEFFPMVVVKTKITSKAGHRIPDG